ncbi:hypothetical protein [Clostridium sp. ATCC 25772]|uniref:hypothetical protein n=1 Tax=Clostridium sp. ATCC 25772 TaxID=1676991 RepID=UPI000782FAAE|nr:hypothetical protein [Clostridium sp. ATCC 25772]
MPKLAVANNISKSGSVSFSNRVYNEAETLISKGISTEASTVANSLIMLVKLIVEFDLYWN